jgi:tRNA/tmRNA/rRNA uracil-C5-methylase (TrmA/RlmC/RlmD family)
MTQQTMEHTVEISSLVYEGVGLGRLPDGKAVFVPFVRRWFGAFA